VPKFLPLIAERMMMQLTTEQRVLIYIVFDYSQNQNTTAVKNAFRARFPDRNPKMCRQSKILSLLRSLRRNVFYTVKQANKKKATFDIHLYLHYTQNQNTTAVKNTFRARFPHRNPEISLPIA